MNSAPIPEDKADEVFRLAAQLQAKAQQASGYSPDELMQAGADAQISAEFIQAALEQLQQQEQAAQQRQQHAKQTQKQLRRIGIGIGAVVFLWTIWTANALSDAEQNVDLAWAQVENQFQRKADLIPNLITVAQSGAEREQVLVSLLTQSRQNYLSAETANEKLQAAQQVDEAIAEFESYLSHNPQLGTSQLFLGLQDEMAGTENRIATERMRYNQAVAAYNQQVSRFPGSILAQLLGFEPRSLFSANRNSNP